MSEFMAQVSEAIEKPVLLTYKPTGEQYTLDFSRESALFAQERGFDPSQILVKNLIVIPEFFWYSLRKNHKNIAKNQAEALFKKLFPDGIPKVVLERLARLYDQAITLNVITDDESKNAETEIG